jgi:integrase
MGTVFKKTFTKPLPAGAELFTREGQQFARWKPLKGKARKAAVTVGEDGTPRLLIVASTYSAKYRDGAGIVRTVATGCRDEQAARSVLADLERRAELVKSGVMTASQDEISNHQTTLLADHFAAFDAALQAKCVTKVYRENVGRALDRLAKDCGFIRLQDLRRESLENWLVGRINEGMSARSRNAYQEAIVAFCNWCVATKRLTLNPFKATPKANRNTDRRRQRRAMTESELATLLDVARRRPLRDAQTVRRGKRKGEAVAKLLDETIDALDWLGRERALIYKTLVLTGLRRGELASLTVGQVHLDGDLPHIVLDAADEKNRQGSEIMLRDDLTGDLRGWLVDTLVRLQAEARRQGEPIPARLPTDRPLFVVPTGLVRILDRDLKLAGIAKRDERGRTLDVHALRTTFGTLLSKGGVAPRTAQAAMRHSSLDLTMQVYTDPKLLDVRGAMDSLPSLPLGEGRGQAASATGTNNLTPRPLAPTLAPPVVQRGPKGAIPDKMAGDQKGEAAALSIDVKSIPVNEKGSLRDAVNEPQQVGATRFELATSWSRTKRSSQAELRPVVLWLK